MKPNLFFINIIEEFNPFGEGAQLSILKDKLNVILTTIKVFVSVFITYLILLKGDAGSLIYHIGTFLVGGNCVVGLSSLANITLLYILAMYNLTTNNPSLKRLKQILLIIDIALIFINLGLSTYIAATFNQMSIDDAINKYLVLTAGAAIVCFVISLIIMLLLLKFQYNLQNRLSLNLNNNPFTFTNRITRKSYLITKILILFIFLAGMAVIKNLEQNEYSFILIAIITFITYGANLFAASKRLRDIKWSQLFLIIWTIPFLGLIIGIPLLFVKTKYEHI